jgi:hypothetical protein
MSEQVEAEKGPRTSCRLCGMDVFLHGLPLEHRLQVYQEVDGAHEAVLRLCRPCADDFVDEDERDAYLERLVPM